MRELHALEKITQGALDKALGKHAMFMRGQVGGRRANFQYKNLSGLDFHNHDLSQADFTGSNLQYADLSLGTFKNACFFACDLRDADLSHGDFSRSDMRGACLSGANLSGSNLKEADMRDGEVIEKYKNSDLKAYKHKDTEGKRTTLCGARLGNADLSGIRGENADFSHADLSKTNIQNAKLRGASFHGANLTRADLSGSDIAYSDMKSAILSDTNFDFTENYAVDKANAITHDAIGKQISDTGKSFEELLDQHKLWIETAGKKGEQLDLSEFDLRNETELSLFPLTAIKAIKSIFLNLDLSRANIQSATLDGSDFRDCYMESADLRGSSFKNVSMMRANLKNSRLSPLLFKNPDGSKRAQRVNFSGADLRFVNFYDADLRDAIFMDADLTQADLRGADLRRADLTGAKLINTNFDGANLNGTIMD